QLAANSSFLEVAWLLIYGELPTADQLGEFDEKIRRHTLLHEDLKRFFSALPSGAHPMAVLSSATSALSTYYSDQSDPDNPEHVLRLNFGVMAEPYEVNPVMAKALERLLLLHEDHEQNASTSTVRLVASTGANQFASVSAGIQALSGPLHGGANEAVLRMLGQIRDSGESVARFVERVKNKEDGVKLMGFGHRVYKNYDPRAK